MKAVMISEQPKQVVLIINGEKKIIVLKTAPKLEPPFKCYIYCTKAKYEHEDFIVANAGTKNATAFYGGGKVIGKFICDKIETLIMPTNLPKDFLEKACLSGSDIIDYLGGDFCKAFYGLHISNLKIYDEPKEISEFRKPCKMGDDPCCGICDYAVHGMDGDILDCGTNLTRPPQSWCYVEEIDE